MKTYMWHRINLDNRIIGMMLCCLSMLPGCITESVDYLPKEGELQTVTFSLDLPQPTMELSRAISWADECRLDDVFLLLFDKSTGGLVDTYEGSNVTTGSDVNIKTFTAELAPGTYDILIVGNCRAILTGANLAQGQTREQVKNALIYQMPAGTWGYTPERFVPFPIYGEKLNITITNSVSELSLIPVVRMVSRIDVYLDESIYNNIDNPDKNVRLVSVRLYNSNRQGQIIPNVGTYTLEYDQLRVMDPSIPTGVITSSEPLLYHVEEPGEELIYTIYTPEAVVGSTDGLENTCLVLGLGNKRDEGTGSTRAEEVIYYYRVDFRNEMSGTLMPLLRNHSYSVMVNSIINNGFPDPDQAYRSKPYDLDYTVKAWELTGDTEAGYDGTYRLDISSTFLEFTGSDYVGIEISTTHPDGWSAYVSTSPTEIITTNMDETYVNLDGAYDYQGNFTTPDQTRTTLEGVPGGGPCHLYFYQTWNPGENKTVYHYIHIVSGNLTNIITVKVVGSRVE